MKLTNIESIPIDVMNAMEMTVKNDSNDEHHHDALKAMGGLGFPSNDAGDSVHKLSVS